MKILLKSATVVDPTSKHHLKKRDVLIHKGQIVKIAATIKEDGAKTYQLPNLHISQGWLDPGVSFGEPGYEERENLHNGLKTAANSGFTHVAIQANTKPVTQGKSQVEFIQSKTAGHVVSAHVTGSLSVDAEGVDLAELYDMHQQGAIAFYDHKRPTTNANLLKIALLYAQNFDGLVQSFPMDPSIAGKGVMNEGVTSTMLGLKGIPHLSETLQINRDLAILEYTGGRLHIPTISAAASVAMIKAAKKKGLAVSCSVSINNLILTDAALENFETAYKLLPPLRLEQDRKALLKGLKEGTIDGITSDHNPLDVERKRVEFDQSDYGSIGLEAAFGAMGQVLSIEERVAALTGLKAEFGIEEHCIAEGSKADLTLFDPDTEWTFMPESICSTSKNAALLGQQMIGHVYGVINNDKHHING